MPGRFSVTGTGTATEWGAVIWVYMSWQLLRSQDTNHKTEYKGNDQTLLFPHQGKSKLLELFGQTKCFKAWVWVWGKAGIKGHIRDLVIWSESSNKQWVLPDSLACKSHSLIWHMPLLHVSASFLALLLGASHVPKPGLYHEDTEVSSSQRKAKSAALRTQC